MSLSQKPLSDDKTQALNAALRLLTRREYAFKELVQKLSQRYTQEAAAAAAEHCRAQGWQSDARCADMLLRHMQLMGYGPLKLRAEALRRGLGREFYAKALQETDWTAIALSCLKKRCPDPKALTREEKQRLLAMLSRRGFTAAQCLSALNLLCSA